MATSFKEKLENSGMKNGLPKIVKVPRQDSARWGGERILIADPKEFDELMKKVPKGRVTTINVLREKLAKKHGADATCPITAGIFCRIAAGAAGEEEAEGRKDVTPYWRTLKGKGELNEKYPGGLEGQAKRLDGEGVPVVRKGKRFVVEELDKYLWE